MAKKSKMIEIDLEINRVIETNRLSFSETHTDILRRLLGLKSSDKQEGNGGGLNLGYGVILPEGTVLKGDYKRTEIRAEIKDGGILLDGEKHNSLSAAAKKFGGPNGWKFWHWVKRPQDSEWVVLNKLRNKELIIKKRYGLKEINLSKEQLAEFE